MRNRSLAFPIVLIGLGALFLINNAMPELSVWHLLADWWPLLLIGFGVIRVLEILARHGTGRPQIQSVRPMGFGWIFILALVVAALSVPAHIRSHFAIDPATWKGNVTGILGDEFDFPVNVETGVGPAIKRVVLDNMRGSITVTGGDRSDVQLSGHKTFKAYDRGAAEKLNAETMVTLTPEGDTIFVRAVEPASAIQAHMAVDMEISVPEGLSVEARGRSGDLAISSVKGNVDVSSQRGEVRLQDIGGNAKVDIEHCDLLRATNLTGTLDLQGSGADVQVEHVDGAVTINGRFSGTLDFKTLAMPLHFASKETDLRVEKLPGTLSMSLSELHGANLTGPIHFVTHERDVNLEGFTGPVDIELGHGDIGLKPAQGAVLARVDARSRSGNIEMALPVGKSFNLSATAQQGEVSNDYGDEIVSESGKGRTNMLRSANPSGPSISLVTERGELSVRKLE